MNTRLALILLPLALAGCAKLNEAGMRLVASNEPTYAVVNGALLSGTTALHVDRTGTLNLGALDDSGLKCMGRLRYTASRSGVIHLQCSDGTDAAFDFTSVRETSGHGSGRTAGGPVGLAFGFEAAQVSAYLPLPRDKRIAITAEGQARLESIPRQ